MNDPKNDPMLVSLMRADPSGDVIHKASKGTGLVATSAESFLREYDRAITEAEQRGEQRAATSMIARRLLACPRCNGTHRLSECEEP